MNAIGFKSVIPSSHKCDFCKDQFLKLNGLKKHIISQHMDIINGTSKVEENYSEKVQKEKSSNKLQCKICDKTVTSLSKLLTHTKIMHKEIKYICETCEKCFKNQYCLTQHL